MKDGTKGKGKVERGERIDGKKEKRKMERGGKEG